jgi:hypothetical protein
MRTMEEVQELLLLSLRELLPSLRQQVDKTIVTKVGKEKLQDAAFQVMDYIELSCGGQLSRNEYLALLSQVLRCLITYLHSAGAPATAANIINSIHLLPHAVDLAFPNYASAGMLRCVVSPSRIGRLQEAS